MHGRARDVRAPISALVAVDASPLARSGQPRQDRSRHVSGGRGGRDGRIRRGRVVTLAGSKPPGRVVIRAPNWLGDAVLALPAMAALRRQFPGAHLAVAAVPAVAAIFREDTDVAPDQVLELS